MLSDWAIGTEMAFWQCITDIKIVRSGNERWPYGHVSSPMRNKKAQEEKPVLQHKVHKREEG